MAGTGATASQAWAILKRHARDEMSPLRLQELCRDQDRVSSLVAVYNATPQRMLLVDLSRQRMTLETLNHLLRLATARDIQKYITQLAWGQNDPDDPIVPVRVLEQQQQHGNYPSRQHSSYQQQQLQQSHHQGLKPTGVDRKTTRFEEADEAGGARQRQPPSLRTDHAVNSSSEGQRYNHNTTSAPSTSKIPIIPSLHLSLRAPSGQGLEMLTGQGINALTAIHSDWERMQRISDSLRKGQWQGYTGQTIKTVVVVGRGVPIMALRFVYLALLKDETAIQAQRAGLSANTTGGGDTYYSAAAAAGGAAAVAALRRRAGGAAGLATSLSTTPSSSSNMTAPATPLSSSQPSSSSFVPQPSYGQRQIKFLTSVDPVRAAAVVADLDPASTLVISWALQGNEETTLATQTLKTWFLTCLGGGGGGAHHPMTTTSSFSSNTNSSATKKMDRRQEIILSKHMMLVTGNENLAAATHMPESSVFCLPEHSRCEAFTSFTAVTLLPLSIVFGWSIVEQFLAGAHDMDGHFVETNPRHNLPVLLALTDVWNDAFLGSTGRVVAPFTEAFAAYPAFCAALEAQACGGNSSPAASSSSPNTNSNTATASSLVIDGGLHHSYDRALYQTGGKGRVGPSEVVMTLDTQIATNASGLHGMDDVHAAQDALICSMFAHVDEMALGTATTTSTTDGLKPLSPGGFGGSLSSPMSTTAMDATNDTADVSEGNRPSTVLLCGKCDAFTCGQMVALAEHRAVVKARLLDVDPFVREVGSSLRVKRTEALKEELQRMFTNLREGDGSNGAEMEEEEGNSTKLGGNGNNSGMMLSTKTILGHYANLMIDQRVYVVKKG